MLNKTDLEQFIGTENWYRHSLVPSIVYTDGVRYVATEAGAYWLLDIIVSAQMLPKVRAEEFQVWKLFVHDGSGLLTAEDGNDNPIYTQHIPDTDFPLPEIKLYFTGNTIMLPTEY